jgi:GntR family transcriptional regulator
MEKIKPIHMVIHDDLLSKIRSGEYLLGDRLPTENELTNIFHSSKSPVRQALEMLRMEGIIYRHPGKGTFVSPKNNDGVWNIGSIQDIIGLGEQTRFQLLKIDYREKSEELDNVFKPLKQETFMRIQGLRLLKDTPLFYLCIHLPEHIGKNIREEDIPDSSVIVTIEKKLGIHLQKCIQNISAVRADKKVARLLRVPDDSPILHIERIYKDKKGDVVEWALNYFNPDLFKYRSELSRR